MGLSLIHICGQIINIASVAAFQPIPYIDVYGASKAFVLSFSRALNREPVSYTHLSVDAKGDCRRALPPGSLRCLSYSSLNQHRT